ncbi:MAG: hypothetical protein JRN39_02585 [Nitrososphaerota archaeon]|nr:hypothetical protein [Nitrososphaerota archaeon]MDG6939269.1 hypothetical protein [Nitrososphaerota archaeon]
MTSYHCFSHAKDCDGLMSAAIFLRAHPESSVTLVDYGAKNIERMVGRMKEALSPGCYISISDFSLNKSTSSAVFGGLAEAKKAGATMLWVDHHRWTVEQQAELRRYAGLRLDTSRCAAEAMKDIYAPTDQVASALASMAHDTDFAVMERPLSRYLSGIIVYYNYLADHDRLLGLVKKFSRGTLWDADLEKDWDAYDGAKGLAVDELKGAMFTSKVGGVTVAVGSCRSVLPPLEAFDMMAGAELGIVLYEDDTLTILRSEGSSVPCNEIAERFRGGGHPFAAGGSLPEELAREGAESKADYIFKVVGSAIGKA